VPEQGELGANFCYLGNVRFGVISHVTREVGGERKVLVGEESMANIGGAASGNVLQYQVTSFLSSSGC
jgi:hypothetical protein